MFFVLLLCISTTYAQIRIDYRTWGSTTFGFIFYTISNHSKDIICSWIRERVDLSDENEIKYHFFKRHGDYNLYNLIVDVEDYESYSIQNKSDYLFIKIRPGDIFTYVFPIPKGLLFGRIFQAKENDVEKAIQSIIPKRLVYNGCIYFVI